MSKLRALSKCLVLSNASNLEQLKLNFGGRFLNFDIILIPSQNNTSEEVLWKRSYKRTFTNDARMNGNPTNPQVEGVICTFSTIL